LTGLLLPAQKVADADPEPPKPGPVGVRLVAKKSTYKLDFGGKSKDEYTRMAKEGSAPPITVDLELVVTNNTKSDIRIRTMGTTTRLTLKLEGDGAVEATPTDPMDRPATGYSVVPPGKSVTIPITTLTSIGPRTKAKGKEGDKMHYWTAAGDYKLSATYYTLMYLDYKQGGGVKPSYMTLESKPVTLKVEK
jgi:hypothetical protein